jgi:ABC-2 type transport system ATP-binding protein
MMELSLKGISKVYKSELFKKRVQAVKDLSLDVAKGEVFGLIGPNGAGKSTTIRMLLGLIRPDTGVIHFRGAALGESAILREVGYLPENPYLYDHLTLRELLEFSGRTSGMKPVDSARRIEELLDKLSIREAQYRPLRTFSKGMLQRAGICFALLHDPSVIILDEPMSGLDPLGRKLVFDIVLELKEKGKTIFFCSHILSDVERLCDRIGILVGGRLVREFEKSDFQEDKVRSVHLLLGPVDELQCEALEERWGEIRQGREGALLSVEPVRLGEAVQYLGSLGVKIHGTRSERVSLEELFLQTVEEYSL